MLWCFTCQSVSQSVSLSVRHQRRKTDRQPKITFHRPFHFEFVCLWLSPQECACSRPSEWRCEQGDGASGCTTIYNIGRDTWCRADITRKCRRCKIISGHPLLVSAAGISMCFHFTNSDSSRSYGNSDNGRTMLKGTKRRELEEYPAHATHLLEWQPPGFWRKILLMLASVGILIKHISSLHVLQPLGFRCTLNLSLYRDRLKGLQILLSMTQTRPGRAGKQEQEQTSRNHVQAF